MEYIVRKAALADAEAILEHTKIVIRETDFLLTTPKEFTATIDKQKAFIQSHQQEGCLFLVAVNDLGEVLGCLNFKAKDKEKVKHVGYFGISMKQAFCNLGIGSKLLTQMHEWAKTEPGVEKVCLEVFSHNERAIHLYKKLGFLEEGRKVRHVKLADGTYVDELLMYQYVK